MSILNVQNLSHGFGDRAIFQDVSFRLLKGEHIGLVGANGEGKSTFMNIITGKLMPDEGKIEWAKNVRVGYLDQHTVLEKGMTIRDVLKSAFSWLFEMEAQMNGICDKMGEASPEELETMMEELGTIQDMLTMYDFYIIDSKVEEVARALGLTAIGLDKDVTDLSGGQRTKVLLGKLLLALLHRHDLLLDRSLSDKTVHGDDILLSNAVRPVRRLILHRNIPPWIIVDDNISRCQVQTRAARLKRNTKNRDIILRKALHHLHPPLLADCSRKHIIADPLALKALRKTLQHRSELREKQNLVTSLHRI